ncbi:MAG: tRNA (adenosine(37)-N6)-threonylcarbamoyltransferase complex dimerization subunit type 1 TsaB [Phycisphaerae bacterium]|nr:tRNA (adenosine(37)-N6)-threonylcarbamoyltransferase complex dimerization subunit type 1 TsaB [Phycisphaerae bacterium]
MNSDVSIAVETSCRAGSVALGRGEELLSVRPLGPAGRHAGELLPALDALLREQHLAPGNVRQVYVSVGPGSFTGLRVGITAVRTLGQMIAGLRIVAVPTAWAVAERLRRAEWQNLAVLLCAKENSAHVTLFQRDDPGGEPRPAVPPFLAETDELLRRTPRPLVITGEALEFLRVDWPTDVTPANPSLRFPDAQSVWRVGRRLAIQEQFTPWSELLPVYARRPEAVRLWEKKTEPSTPLGGRLRS